MSGVVEWVVGGPDPAAVMRDTWGHLDARPGVTYPGTILFAESEYGEQVVLRSEFGDEAGHGPWFYEGVHAWLFEQDTESGKVYRFTGTYRLTRGAHTFVGEVAEVQFP